MQEVSKTRGIESASSSNTSISHNASPPTPPFGSHQGNDKDAPDKVKGNH